MVNGVENCSNNLLTPLRVHFRTRKGYMALRIEVKSEIHALIPQFPIRIEREKCCYVTGEATGEEWLMSG